MGTQAVELPVTPTTLLARCASQRFVFLLDGQGPDSWGNGEAVFGFAPRSVLRVEAFDHGEVDQDGVRSTWQGDPFALLERFCAAHVPAGGPSDGRAVIVALNYDLRRCIERFDRPAPTDAALPLLVAAAYDWTLTHSYRTGRFTLHTAPDSRVDPQAIAATLQRAAAQPPPVSAAPGLEVDLQSSPSQHAAAVRRILDYIAAGDVYQVNLAHRFCGRGEIDAVGVFAAMQRLNAVPFAAYLGFDDLKLLSNSPECLLTVHGNQLSTAPIKGTRRRGANPAEDLALQQALLADPKERAEHVMVVDLERNDLGRVSRPGSVRVDGLATLHTFPGLHHMVSTVHGERRADAGLAALLRATFPGGSVTGAPKIRAMQIIDELEPFSRGFYTGAIGCIRGLDEAIFSLTIRTATVHGDHISYWAGGGIVADSVPEREYDETILKARPFLTAVANPSA